MIVNPIQTRFIRSICVSGLLFGAASAVQSQPLASNNGMYPKPSDGTVLAPDTYSGVFNIANMDYPRELPETEWLPGGGLNGPLSTENAAEYMAALKDHIEPTFRVLIEDVQSWDAVEANWYNTVWRGAGEPGNPISGREAIMNTNTGQIVPSHSWSEPYRPTTDWMQNFGVIYYNPRAAYTLGQVWEDLYNPKIRKMNFAEGSIVVKVEAATVQPEEWPWNDPDVSVSSVLEGAAEWHAYRPTTEDQKAQQLNPDHPLINQVQTVYPFQMAIKVKDTVAAPETGWVFMGFVFDARIEGTVWDKFVPAGMMWGNDPEYANTFDGKPPEGETLKETWVNPDAPPFVEETLGWGGRMAAPMDVAVRHQVVLPNGEWHTRDDGFRASSCLSCHGTAQFPFTANLYPSPNRVFPPDGMTFPMYMPGSAKWAEWFQNRRGDEPQSDYPGIQALDYDLTSMIALGIWAGSTGRQALAFEVMNGH